MANFVLILGFSCGISDTLIKNIIYNHWQHRLYRKEILTPTINIKLAMLRGKLLDAVRLLTRGVWPDCEYRKVFLGK